MQKTKAIAIKKDFRAIQHYSFMLLLAVVAYVLLTCVAHAQDASSLLSGITGANGSVNLPTTTTGFMGVADFLFSGLNSPMEEVLCTILLIILGDAGRGIATLAVMGMGFGAMMGKVSWGQAMTVAVGIGIMFGAPFILPLILFDPTGAISGLVSGATGSNGSIGGAISGAVAGGGLGVACM